MKNSKWLFFILAFLMVLFTTWSAVAYEVNKPLTVQVKFQYDDGLSVVDVVTQSCDISVYFQASQGNFTPVVIGAPMSGGSYHVFVFTPQFVGDYVLSVECSYGNESAVYNEVVRITPLLGVVGGGGGQVLNLNAKIVPERSLFVVNIAVQSDLVFGVSYYLDGKLVNSNQAEYRLLSGDRVLSSGGFVIKNTGEYVFDYDFKDQLTGSYRVALFFDGRTEFVDVRVISVSEDLSPITGFVVNSDGEVSVFKAGVLIFFVLFILLLVVVFIRSLRKGGRK
jgi:hypothetical protein